MPLPKAPGITVKECRGVSKRWPGGIPLPMMVKFAGPPLTCIGMNLCGKGTAFPGPGGGLPGPGTGFPLPPTGGRLASTWRLTAMFTAACLAAAPTGE